MFRNTLARTALFLLFFMSTNFANAQNTENLPGKTNNNTVSILTGGVDYESNKYMNTAKELAEVLDEEDGLRLSPVLGYGSIQNIGDLLTLRDADIAIVHSDVLTYLEERKLYPNAKNKIRYIANLYNEMFYAVAGKDIRHVKQLAGKKVVVAMPNSGSEMSTQTLFSILGVKPVFIHHDWKTGIEKVRSGEAAAMVYPAPSPSKFLQEANGKGLHLLELPVSKELLKTYYPALLSNDDYPNLVAPGKQVQTLQFGALMAVYDWKPGTERHRKVAKFAEQFLANLDNFKKSPGHPGWRKLDVSLTMPRWKRFQPVQDWLKANPPQPAKTSELKTGEDKRQKQFAAFLTYMQSKDGQSGADGRQLVKLYLEFQQWQKQNAREKPDAPTATTSVGLPERKPDTDRPSRNRRQVETFSPASP